MADQSLQAFQLGASLFDRAQTQQRLMEQFQLQAADQVMRKQHYDIQNKIATDDARIRLDEQTNFLADLPTIQGWQKDYLKWNAEGDPTKPFPQPPTNLKSMAGLKMIGDMSGPVLQSLPMAQNRFFTQAAYNDQLKSLNGNIEILKKNGKFDLVNQYNGGLDQNLRIDQNAAKILADAAAPFVAQGEKLATAAKISSVAALQDEDAIKALGLPAEIELQAIQAMRAKKAQKSPLTAALSDWQTAPEEQKDAKFQILKAAAAKSGQDVVVGPSGEFEFKKALPQQLQTQLFNGIKSANAAIELIDSITDSELKNAFNVKGAARSLGQKIPLVPKFGGGLNQSQLDVNQKFGMLTGLSARGLLSETGRLTEGDAKRAERLLSYGFATSSPEQVRQSLNGLKSLFQEAKDRMKSPFEGIIGSQEVLKIDTKQQDSGGQPQTQVQATDVFSAMKQPPLFNSVEEAERKVPSGTKYKVGNKFYLKQ
jgi:uncharacterized protein YhfF